jgi:cytochrome c oxidase subunit 2
VRRPPCAGRLLLLASLAVATAGCSLPSGGAPDPASDEGSRIHSLWQGFLLAALAVGALVWGLLVYVLIRYRRRNDDVPQQRPYNIPVEVIYTVTPVLVVAVLFGFSVATENRVTAVDDDDAAVEVEVIGFQWSWQFRYPDEDLIITGVPGEPPEMVLPVDRPAHLRLVSTDVNHSFWVPDFLSKRDLIPGVDNEIQVTPTQTGSYVGRCAEFCGLDHWRMNFSVRVVTDDEYDDWLASHD